MSEKQLSSDDLVDEVVEGFRQERPDLDSMTIETVCRLIYVGRIMEQRASKSLAPFGMNYTDLDVLGTLRRSGPPFELTPADLIRSVMITSGAMTTCLDRLESGGFILRRVSETDRRVRRIRLTESGKELIDRVLTKRFGDAQEEIGQIGSDDLCQLNQYLRTVIATGLQRSK